MQDGWCAKATAAAAMDDSVKMKQKLEMLGDNQFYLKSLPTFGYDIAHTSSCPISHLHHSSSLVPVFFKPFLAVKYSQIILFYSITIIE